MRFAQQVFRWAGILGVIIVAPMYFLEDRIGRDLPPAITHPEYFYGFIGVTLAWQVVYLIIATDPVRYRPLMLTGVLAKGSYATAVAILFLQGRVAAPMATSALFDLTLAVLFALAYVKTASGKARVA